MSSHVPVGHEFTDFAELFLEGLFVNLQSFADESGTHDATGCAHGSEVAVVAGFLSWKKDWGIFCQQWRDALDAYRVPVFHMSEFVADERGPVDDPAWPYHGWSREKKDQFIRVLVRIARDNTLCGLGGLVSVRDYDRLVPAWIKDEVQHPYHFCFQLFFDCLLKQLKTWFQEPFPVGEQVAFFFDQQDEFKEKALRTFDNVKALKDDEHRMGSIAFVCKEKYVALQAADLAAYRMRKMLTRRLRGQPTTIPGSWDEELSASSPW
jgi:hypothetical protein